MMSVRCSRDEGSADNFIGANVKFGVAVDAGYVLALLLGGCGATNVDLLRDFAVRAFNHQFSSRDSSDALQSRNQLLTGFGFAYEAMRPRSRSGLETRTIVDCQKHYLGCGRDSSNFLCGCNAIQNGHVDVHEHYFWLQLYDFFDGFFPVLRVSADLEAVPIQEFAQRCSRGVVIIHN
jgi:hypothetical protein